MSLSSRPELGQKPTSETYPRQNPRCSLELRAYVDYMCICAFLLGRLPRGIATGEAENAARVVGAGLGINGMTSDVSQRVKHRASAETPLSSRMRRELSPAVPNIGLSNEASGVARGDGPGRHWPDLSLRWLGGSRDFDNHCHCPAIDGHHIIVYALSTGRLFRPKGKRELHAEFVPGSAMIRPAGSVERVYGAVPERLRIGVSERLVAQAMAEIANARAVDLVPVFSVNDPIIHRGASILWDELLKPQHPAQRLLVEGVATMLAAHRNEAQGGIS
jgi:hypothetical protein